MQPLEFIHSWTKGTLPYPILPLPYPTLQYHTLPYPFPLTPTLPLSTYPYPTLPYFTLPYPTPFHLPYPTLPLSTYSYPTPFHLPYPTLPYPLPPALPCPALPYPTPCSCPYPPTHTPTPTLPYLHIAKPVAVELCCHATTLIVKLILFRFFRFFLAVCDLKHDKETIHGLCYLLIASGNLLYLKYEQCL